MGRVDQGGELGGGTSRRNFELEGGASLVVPETGLVSERGSHNMGVTVESNILKVRDPKLDIPLFNAITRSFGCPNAFGAQIPVDTHWNLVLFEQLLEGYYDKHEVILFLKFGWPLSFDGREFSTEIPENHGSCLAFEAQVQEYIDRELSCGALLGPFETSPFSAQACFSPLSTRPKRDSTERRVLHNLSWPLGNSINSGIDKNRFLDQEIEWSLPSVDNLVAMILTHGRGSLSWRIDIKRFYRQIYTDFHDVNLLGFTFKGKMYWDLRLPMGGVSSVYIAQRIGQAISYAFKTRGYLSCCYIDDHASNDEPVLAWEAFYAMRQLLLDLNIQESVAKALEPATRMVFLGIMTDSDTLLLEIDSERLFDIKQEVNRWRNKTKATLKEVQSLVGVLSFAAKAVRQSRIFFSRLLDFLRQAHAENQRFLDIPEEIQSDLRWWAEFAPTFNGVTMMPPLHWEAPDRVFSVDASLQGAGGFSMEGENSAYFFKCAFPEKVKTIAGHISALEIFTVKIACQLWAHRFTGKNILIYTDNQSTRDVINSGKSRDRTMQNALRTILFLAATHQFQIRVLHLSTLANRRADALSRVAIDPAFFHTFLEDVRGLELTESHVTDECFDLEAPW